MKYVPLLNILLFFVAGIHHTAAQGCSDAGICNIRSFRPLTDNVEDLNNHVSAGISIGAADHEIMAGGAHVSYSRKLGNRFSSDLRVTYFLHSGNDISVSGPGDVYANINYKPSMNWTLMAGVKVPLTDGGKFYTSTMPLPMDYQSSLGTLDVIGGIGYYSTKWQLVLAYQHPVVQNDNSFDPGTWPEGSPLRGFVRSFGYTRKPDLMMRVSYPMVLHEKLTITPSLLPIYHLGEDEYYDANDLPQSFVGSDGLTINANVFFDVSISKRSKLTIGAGFPVLVREVRPDGLTRGVVLGVDYGVMF